MLTEKRQSIILSLLEDKGSVSVPELCAALNSSESTIRRDLCSLDRGGWLKKVRGGAVAVDSGVILSEPDVSEKKKLFSEEKDIIANVKKAWTKSGNKVGDIKTMELYIKPEESAVYYVINGTVTGSVEF